MPDYEIVDWIYEKLKATSYKFKNQEDLRDEIKKLDTKDILNPWLNGSWEDKVNCV